LPVTSQLRRQVHNIGRRRAWVIWLVGLSVYGLAVFHRTSLGVAGILAAERFGISASQLATFTVVQLGVYAAMQIPVGVLLDRFGSRRLMLVGLGLMTVGQFWFAFAQDFTGGLAARVLLGVGDAMIFTSLLRLVALWFRVKQAPMVTQVTGVLGQLGAIAAASPLAYALNQWGWTTSFTVAASVGVVLSVLLFFVVKDSPYTGDSVEKIKIRALGRTLAEVWGNPGTRLGLWVHFTSQFGATVFTMLWGYPFLVAGEGLSSQVAGLLLIVMTVTAMVAGPVIGMVTARVPYRRSQIVLSIVVAIVAVWAVVLLWPGRAPLWLLVLLVVVVAIGGPGSMVGFDLARTFHPSERLGRASGVINVGGFVASLLTIGLIGLILDHRAPGGPSTYTLDDFRVAMSVQFVFWGLGIVQLVRYRRRGLAHIDEHPGALEALRRGETLLPGLSRDPD
jgi:sugar phosphate permease